MASFTPAGSGGIPVTANIPGVTAPTIQNFTISSANTEYSYTFPPSTKRFLVKLRDPGALKVAYTSGDTATLYVTIPPNCFYGEDELEAISITLYFQSPVAGSIVELVSWV